MLSHLHNRATFSHNLMIDVYLPAGEVEQFIFFHHSDGSSSNVVPNCTYLIRFASEGICHVANILCMLVDISMAAAASYDPTPAYQDYMAWMLDSFLTAHEQRKLLKADAQLYESCRRSDIATFSSLQAILSASKAALSDTILQKGYTILSILCADLLETAEDLAEPTLQLSVCSSILNLVGLCRGHFSMHRVVSLHLVPAIQLALKDGSKSSGLGKDFQVIELLRHSH